MNLQNQPPVFVPPEHRAEIEKLSKAALMDMVWDLLDRGGDGTVTMDEFRKLREIILLHRQQAKTAPLASPTRG